MLLVMICIGLSLARKCQRAAFFGRPCRNRLGKASFIADDDVGVRIPLLQRRQKHNEIKMSCCSKAFRARCSKGQGNARGNALTERTSAGKDKLTSTTLLSDQRGAVAFETVIVYLFMVIFLLLPLADVAIAGLKFNSAYQALRDMGQLTQYSNLDASDPASISTWQSSLPTTVDGYTVSATVKCGDAGTAPPCAGTTWPKYYIFSTTFTLSPMVLGSVLCSTCTVNYSQRFQ
jgi:hypothetical protein